MILLADENSHYRLSSVDISSLYLSNGYGVSDGQSIKEL